MASGFHDFETNRNEIKTASGNWPLAFDQYSEHHPGC